MPIFRKDGRRFLFIHVPKTGGSSIERAFHRSGYETNYLDGKKGVHWNHVRRCSPQHMHAEMLDTIFRLDQFDGIFMVVRDPLARLRSEYLWRNRNRELSVSAEAVETWVRRTFSQYETNPFVYDNHIRPQVEFQVPDAKVYSFESGLDAAVASINDTWDLGLPDELPRIYEGHTATQYSSRDVELNPATTRLIRDFYAADLARYGYDAAEDTGGAAQLTRAPRWVLERMRHPPWKGKHSTIVG